MTWICEQHPWLPWPHHDCAGPGMPENVLLALHETCSVMSDDDQRAFRRLLFAVRRAMTDQAMSLEEFADAAKPAMADLEHYVEMRSEQAARSHPR